MARTERQRGFMICLRRAAAALLAAWLTVPLLAAVTAAQDFPTRTVRIVVAFPAGGPTDFVGRLLADQLKSLLGQSVVVENRPALVPRLAQRSHPRVVPASATRRMR